MNNEGKYITHIVESTTCLVHPAPQGTPCWAMPGGKRGNVVVGVCGKRIKKAGYNGTISAQSMRSKGHVSRGPKR